MSAWKTVKLFVSSTFRDTQLERDILVRRVFPRLRAELLKYRLHLEEVDLRWGITKEENTLDVCEEVLNEALPRFLGIIGDRYGWIPPDNNPERLSITEREMRKALEYSNSQPAFLFRNPPSIEGIPFLTDSDANVNGDEKLKKLKALKKLVRGNDKARCREYFARGEDQQLVLDDQFEQIAYDVVLESLQGDPELKDWFVEKSDSTEISFRDETEAFCQERLLGIDEALHGGALEELRDATQSEGLVLLYGAGGLGKTSLMARIYQQLTTDSSNELDRPVLGAFIGGVRGISTVRELLAKFVTQLSSENPEVELRKLADQFSRLLEEQRPIVILDALDQLSPSDRAHYLSWIPNPLPEGVTLIASTLDEQIASRLRMRGAQEIKLSPLGEDTSRRVLEGHLFRFKKKLDDEWMETMMHKEGAGNPLFLHCAAEELRTLGDYEAMPTRIAQMPPDVGGLFLWVLKRLESDTQFRWEDGPSKVRKLVSCLGVSREGLSEVELTDLVGDEAGDVSVWLRLLRPYLAYRGDLLSFYHRAHADAVFGRGVGETSKNLLGDSNPGYLDIDLEIKGAHSILADYFGSLAPNHPRRMAEYVHHLIFADRQDEAEKELTDFASLRHKVEAGFASSVRTDMRELLKVYPAAGDRFRLWQRFFKRRAQAWQEYPTLFHQDCLNEPEGLDTCKQGKDHPIQRNWMRHLNKSSEEINQWSHVLNHDHYIFSAIFTLDGMQVVTASWDRTARIWDAETGEELCKLQHDEHQIFSANFSLDGRHVVTASADKTARIWDATTGTEIRLLPHNGEVYSANFSPDGKIVVTLSGTTVLIWNAKTGKERRSLIHDQGIKETHLSPDGKQVVTVCFNNTARIWDTKIGKKWRNLIHSDKVNSAHFSPDSRHVVTASADKTARIWDTTTGTEIRNLPHNGEVYSANFSPDGELVVTASADKTARIWNAKTGKEQRSLPHNDKVYSANFSPDGEQVVTVSDQTAQIWNILTGAVTRNFIHYGEINCAHFSPGGEQVIIASDQTAQIWNILTGTETRNFIHYGKVNCAHFSLDGERVVTASSDKTARIVDAITGAEILSLPHSDKVNSAHFSIDGKQVVTASGDNTASVWDAVTGAEIRNLPHNSYLHSAHFSPDGKQVVTASDDMTALIWNILTGAVICSLPHYGAVNSAHFSPDGKQVVTASAADVAAIWDAVTGTEIRFLPHYGAVNSAHFSPDGKQVVTASDDMAARIWDAVTGIEIRFLPHHSEVCSAYFSSDGEYVVTASRDEITRIWCADTGEKVITKHGNIKGLNSYPLITCKARNLYHSGDLRKKVVSANFGCQMCLGMGFVDMDDINRQLKTGFWLPGRCRLCATIPVPPLARMVFDAEVMAMDSREDGLIVAGLQNGQVCFLRCEEVE
jgi:WD40 repeat protein